MGKSLGNDEVQVRLGEFVRSWMLAVVEKVPKARNCAVSCKLPTVTLLGTIVSESRGSGAAVIVTVTVALEVTTLPSGLVSLAVMVVVPALAPVATPAVGAG